jgi:hypothetical protein
MIFLRIVWGIAIIVALIGVAFLVAVTSGVRWN